MNFGALKIDKTWSLFLDRDGVINTRIAGGYVKTWKQFEFIHGVKEAIALCSGHFGKIVVVSNQQGVGKGLMTEKEVEHIHEAMRSEISKNGGRIDAIYFCPFLDEDHSIMRKPNIGMALKARKDFPDIRFKRSVMVGDSLSDMIFGKRLGMKTVFAGSDQRLISGNAFLIDLAYPDLLMFASALG